jgi:hypothetical protein
MNEPAVTPLAETSDELEANLWADALRHGGVRTEIMTMGARGALGGGVMFPGAWFRLLVSTDDIDEARAIIADAGGADRIADFEVKAQQNPMRLVWIMAAVIAAFLGAGLVANLLA